ncbi:DMT family transporter [Papillibacter cinnamivorans]|uniref:Threonine/homoserine efflux transporter RhtA n=1 Tax=Papillibacter cinnamivorans DSM 12816 TaxID=1122930 RepID=A0A1W2CRX3_9FIRM|nr:DMT family transporter [Papillibacter cinnamivorans]SMC87704.1 Threonine/homoserine efflux transporter RhtA [Papillibacter cinnamivorans DSM 12816]
MKKGYLYILLSAVLFSSVEIALKFFAGSFNPIQLSFLRFLIGAVVLMPLSVKGLKKRNRRFGARDFSFFALTGFICVVISMVLYQMALLYSPASMVAVLICSNPVFIALFAHWILREEVHKHTVFSLIVSIAGIIVILNPGHVSGQTLGLVLTVLAAVTVALYSVIGHTRSGEYGGVALTCFTFLFGSMEMLSLICLTRIGFVSSFFAQLGLPVFSNIPILSGINGHTLPSLLFIGVFNTGLGYAFYFLAMEATSAITASLVFFIKPALAPVLALLIVHEAISVHMIFGILLILGGSMISLIPGFKAARNKASKSTGKEYPEPDKNESRIEIEQTAVPPE